MKEKYTKLVRLLPMIMLFVFLLRTGYKWYTHQILLTPYHYWAIGFFLLNAFLYLVRFNFGIVTTGLVLLLATFGLLVFDPARIRLRYEIDANNSPVFKFPFFSPIMLFMLIFYIMVNWTFFSDVYRRYKLSRRRNNSPKDKV